MRYPIPRDEGWSIDEARARLERRRDELAVLLAWLDTDPSGARPVAHLERDPLECDGGVEELELRAVERALARIADLTYGTCDGCGGPIERARLRRVPWSRCCAECVAFWEGALGTGDGEPPSGCASCRAERAGPLRAAISARR
jgi:hypothetical protein